MGVGMATVWGLTGGLCVEALTLYAQIHRTKKWDWRRPIDQGMVAFVVAVVIRVGVGAALAAAFAGSHQVSGSIAAFALGAGAPVVVERLAKAVPVTDPRQASFPPATAQGGSGVPSQSGDALQTGVGCGQMEPIASDLTGSGSDAG